MAEEPQVKDKAEVQGQEPASPAPKREPFTVPRRAFEPLVPEDAPPLGFFGRLWEGWKAFAKRISFIGRFMSFVIMSLLFALFIPFFQFLRISDPLGKRLRPQLPSYWQARPEDKAVQTIERVSLPF